MKSCIGVAASRMIVCMPLIWCVEGTSSVDVFGHWCGVVVVLFCCRVIVVLLWCVVVLCLLSLCSRGRACVLPVLAVVVLHVGRRPAVSPRVTPLLSFSIPSRHIRIQSQSSDRTQVGVDAQEVVARELRTDVAGDQIDGDVVAAAAAVPSTSAAAVGATAAVAVAAAVPGHDHVGVAARGRDELVKRGLDELC